MKGLLATCVTTATLLGCGSESHDAGDDILNKNIAKAEEFVDAFYSFDPGRLTALLDRAESSRPAILFYQGWAEGGNYKIVNRQPCRPAAANTIVCPVTVDDDLINALGIAVDVTDTFEISFSDGAIVSVETSSDDPPEFHAAKEWVKSNRSELIEVSCQGYFAGGPTPGACVKAMVQGYKAFATRRASVKEG